MNEMNREYYFAASNSKRGFVSYFQDVFSPDVLDRIYIIKGGPGTGKSRFMREVGAFFEDLGEKVTYFLCSSDPQSLDGVLIEGKRLAFLDGTAPHTVEAQYPVAVEQIIDLANFCDENLLLSQKERIRTLCDEKKKAWKCGYHFLRAAGEADQEIIFSQMGDILHDKMYGAAYRFCQKYLQNEETFSENIRLCGSINHAGIGWLSTFDRKSDMICGVDDGKGIGFLFLNEVHSLAKKMGKSIDISFDPLNPERINAVYFHKEKICFRLSDKKEADKLNHFINMNRFIRKNAEKSFKNRVRFAQKCKAALIAGAAEQFALAKDIHTMLENIYAPSLNIAEKEVFTKRFIQSVSENGVG